jgi:rubrerythrin
MTAVKAYLESGIGEINIGDDFPSTLNKLVISENEAIIDYRLALKIFNHDAYAKGILEGIIKDEQIHAGQLKNLQMKYEESLAGIDEESKKENNEDGKTENVQFII